MWALCLAFILFIPVIVSLTGGDFSNENFIYLSFPATLGLIYISYKTFKSKITLFGILPLNVAAGVSVIFYNLIAFISFPTEISIGICIFSGFVSIKYWSSNIKANPHLKNVNLSDTEEKKPPHMRDGNTFTCNSLTKTYTRKGFYRVWVSLLGLAKVKSVTFYPDQVSLNFKVWKKSIEYDKIDKVRISGIFLKKISFKSGKHWASVSGLSSSDAKRFYAAYEGAASESFLTKFQRLSQEINDTLTWIEEVQARTFYLRSSVYAAKIQKAKNCIEYFSERIPKKLSQSPEILQLEKIRSFLEYADSHRLENNKEYLPIELDRNTKLFDQIENNPLTDEQRKSVVVDEDANLVIAAAGSGKTSVIVAKAAWLIEKKLRAPEEILLLAFGKPAQKEMEERIENKLKGITGTQLTVNTFHSLGITILSQVSGHKPTLSKLAKNENGELEQFIRKTISTKLSDNDFFNLMMTWFSEFFAPYESEFNFENLGQYSNYIRRNKIISLKGDRVKSFEECEVANFLFLNGVNYEYEPDYKHDTSTAEKRQYQPDFYLTDFDIYIEHLGLRGFGRTASFVDRRSYIQSAIWKRNLHKKHGTNLIETYSCEKAQGILSKNLRKKLIANGVKLQPLSSEKTFTALNERKKIDEFTQLVVTFLGHYKGAQFTESDLNDSIGKLENTDRHKAFIKVFLPIYESYQNELKSEGKIDFHDMINEAIELVTSGKFQSPFGYIMVDEFQDISVGRANLIKALQKSNPDAQIFCVGDDWQAIYRFTGADINIMKKFAKNFGDTARSDLTKTFRCEEKIAEHATNFVLQNDFQISKNVNAVRQSHSNSVIVSLRSDDETEQIRSIISIISDELKQKPNSEIKSVLFLGRYKSNILSSFAEFDYYKLIESLNRNYDNLDINYMTMHGSKGLEADYVIILDHGFPSEKVDDPILNLVLAEPELYPNAEERRLFYVALTRAKEKVFIASKSQARSPFVDEIIKNPIDFSVLGKEIPYEPKCPKCIEGRLVLREPHAFWGCINYNRFKCSHKEQACPFCKTGYPVRLDKGKLTCSVCEQEIVSCPKEGCDGFLEQRSSSRTGNFWGCTNFRNETEQCKYTRNELYDTERPKLELYRAKQSRSRETSQKTTRPQKYKKHGKPWTRDEIFELKRLVRDGLSDELISEKMERSPRSIEMQRERILKIK